MFLFRIYVIQLRKKEIVVLAVGRVSSGYFPVWNVYRTARKRDFIFLASVRVSSQYFAVSDCVSYSCAKKRSWLSLWLGLAVGIFQFWNVYRTVRKKYFVFLARVRVSSQYFPDLDCIPYSCARKRSWISLWLRLAVDIFQFGMYIVQYARRTPCFSLELVLAVSIFQFGMCIVQYARRTSCFSLESELAVSIFQFWIVYRTVRKKDFVFLARVRVSSQYFPVWIVYHTVAQERDRISRCGYG